MSEEKAAAQRNQLPGAAEELLSRYAAGERSFVGAELPMANLSGANLAGIDLRSANFRGANLRGANLQQAKLFGAILGDADLQDADLKGATGLFAEQLRGTNVCGAKLPEEIKIFDGLKNIEEMSKHANNLFVTLLLACVYGWLTIGTTTDALLLTNSASSPLPVIGAAVPIVAFYSAAPLFLLGLYLYLHLHLQRLWEGLANLPAIFPDGRPLDQKVYPWLLNGLVCAYFPRLKENRPALSRLQVGISVFVAWWIGPATIFLFWARYLRRHDWLGTTLHIALLVVSIGVAITLQSLAASTMRGKERKPFVWKYAWKDVRAYKRCAMVVAIAAIFYPLSLGAIDGFRADYDLSDSLLAANVKQTDVRIWVPRAFALVGYRPFADLREADVSVRPPNWTGQKKEEFQSVKRARLREGNLRYADAYRAFLVGADLNKANLQGAYFHQADLRSANLKWADLQEANLSEADLQEANLEKANLRRADLNQANLSQANLTDANLSDCYIEEAILTGANLQGAILKGANLTKATGLTRKQMERAIIDEKTKLPAYLKTSTPPLR